MLRSFITTLVLGLLISNPAFAAAPEDAADMSPEQQEIMTRMEAYATPTENHDILAQMVGTWKAEVKYWMDPASEPQVMTGTSVSEMILGGRYLEQRFTGDSAEQPFTGRGLYGYDNLLKQFQNLWIDDMSTGMMHSTGSYNPETQTITEQGMLTCPITNGPRAYRGEMIFNDDGTIEFNTYMDDMDGNEFQSMAITYTKI